MPAGNAIPWRLSNDTIVLVVRLTPKGGRDAIDGVTDTPDGPALEARVRAAPENGAANAALEQLVADVLALPKRNIALISGHKSRTKSIALTGNFSEIEPRLIQLVATTPPRKS